MNRWYEDQRDRRTNRNKPQKVKVSSTVRGINNPIPRNSQGLKMTAKLPADMIKIFTLLQ